MNQTKKRRGALLRVALVVAGLTLATLPGVAQAQAGAAKATPVFYANGINLRPNVGHAGAVLTVSRGEAFDRQAFGAGETPSIELFDSKGVFRPDGIYTWELELLPDAETARALRQAASLNGGEAPDAWERLSGTFTILGGQIVSPDLGEAGTRPSVRAPAIPSESSPATRSARTVSAVDDDAAVGFREGVEEAMRAASAATPVRRAASGGLTQPDPRSLERSDAAAEALGRSLEALPAARAQAAPARREPPRSDGSHGRKKDE